MSLPFDAAQFFGVFVRYNDVVWPAQLLLVVLAGAASVLAVRPRVWSDRAIGGVLALLWLWMGVVYHLGFFSAINPAARLFGGLFIFEGLALGTLATIRGKLRFRFRPGVRGTTGALLIGFGLLGYPLLAYAVGHRYPATATFGLPCPTTIFTLGMLLWLEPGAPGWILAVPLAWSAVGASAATQLGVREDLSLVVAGAVSAVVTIVSRQRSANPRELVPR